MTVLDHEEIGALEALGAGDASKLIALLHSDRPLHPEVRALLADVLDPVSTSTWRLVFVRRCAGSTKKVMDAAIEQMSIGVRVATLIETGDKYDAAIAQVCADLKKSRTTVTDAYSIYRDAVQRLASEESD